MSNIGENLEKYGEDLVSRATRTNAYRCLDIDLTIAHVNTQQGLKSPGFKFRAIIIIRNDAAFTIRLNNQRNDPIPIPAGTLFNWNDHDYDEMYITNAAGGAGSRAVILCPYNRQESRSVKG